MFKNKNLIILILILLLAAFLRLYRISDYMTFLGDEGRDVLVAKDILHGQLTLLGPRASAGDFFLGPIYYYMIAPFLLLFNYDPVGPAVMVALFGIATVYLIYYVGKKLFSEKAGLAAAALYSVSPLVINYSHSSWNPNVLPFFSLLLMLTIYKALEMGRKSGAYFFATGILLGISLQLHYLALFLGILVFFFVFFGKWYINKKIMIVSTIKNYLQIFIGFLLGFSPFLAFEARHGFPNIKTIFGFIFSDTINNTSQGTPFFKIVLDVFYRVFARLVFHSQYVEKYFNSQLVSSSFAIIIILISSISIVYLYNLKNKLPVIMFYLWLFLGVVLFGFYKKPIYDYYFTFMFPLPFLIIGNFISSLTEWKNKRGLGIAVGTVVFFGLFIFNLLDMPFRYEPNRQKDQIKTISEFVLSKTDNKPFNFALITPGNSDHGYRYYFEILNNKPVRIDTPNNDPERKSVTDQLLVICEQIDCKPEGHPLFDIAGFGPAKVSGNWSVSHVKVYKLIHSTKNN